MSIDPVAQMYLECARDTYSEMSVTEFPHLLTVVRSPTLQLFLDHSELTIVTQFLKWATVDFISHQDEGRAHRPHIRSYSLLASGILSHDHCLQQPLHIVFDGFDELIHLLKDEPFGVRRLLKGKLKEAQIVVSSRPGFVTHLSGLWQRATRYKGQGVRPREVKQDIELFFLKKGEPSAASELLSFLTERPNFTDFTYIPLNLWLICSMFSFKTCALSSTVTQGCLSQHSYLCYFMEELMFDKRLATCLSSHAKLKETFDAMNLLHVCPKKHSAKNVVSDCVSPLYIVSPLL